MNADRSLVLLLALAATLSASHARPQITRQPANQSVSLGANITFAVSATGTPPVTFQWRFNETDVEGATLRNLSLTNVQTSHAGSYAVVVSDASGSVTSEPAILTVDSTFTRITSGDIVTRIGRSQGIAWADYDGDGHLDIYVTHGGNNHEGILYRNMGDDTFSRIASGATGIEQRSTGCAWADSNNDGYLDLFAAAYNQTSVLYRNDRSGDFTRSFFELGQRSVGPAWGDYDNDGYVDLFVSNGGAAQFATPRMDFLYHNDGKGNLVKMTTNQVGIIAAHTASGVGAAWADYDDDGHLDLVVAIWGSANLLYRNTGQGSFERVLDGDIVNSSANSMGCAWGDYDNDGDLDLFVANGSGQNNFLYLNNGGGSFTPVTEGSLVNDGGESAGCAWGDFDNDGWLDLYVSNGHSRAETNFLYRNNGDGSFTRITEGSLVNESFASWGCAWGDYTNDGFLDLFVANGSIVGDQANSLFRNNGNQNGWLGVRCVGTRSNRSGIGAKVRVQAMIGGRTFWQLREINTGDGISGNALDAHFGLGDATRAETVQIKWPSGISQELHNVSGNQLLTVTEPTRLEPIVSRSGGLVELSIKSWEGLVYQIEASSDLKVWTPLSTLTNSSGTLQFADPLPMDVTLRFYRVRSE